MAYQTVNIIVKPKQKALHQYFQANCMLAKNIYNATLFRCRQILTADKKTVTELTANELEILREFLLLSAKENDQKICFMGSSCCPCRITCMYAFACCKGSG